MSQIGNLLRAKREELQNWMKRWDCEDLKQYFNDDWWVFANKKTKKRLPKPSVSESSEIENSNSNNLMKTSDL